MKNIPEKIYIQVGEDVEQDEDFKELDAEAVTWCADKVFHNDIEYIRKDLIPQYMQCDEACEYHCTKNGEQPKECEQHNFKSIILFKLEQMIGQAQETQDFFEQHHMFSSSKTSDAMAQAYKNVKQFILDNA